MPLHPMLVHLPLGLAIILPLFLFVVAWAIRAYRLDERAWWLMVMMSLITVVGSVMAVRSGDSEEDPAENIVAHRLIEDHEQAGVVFLYSCIAVLCAIVVTAFLRRRKAQGVAMAICIALAVVSALLGMRAGHSGGELVYQHGAANVYAAP